MSMIIAYKNSCDPFVQTVIQLPMIGFEPGPLVSEVTAQPTVTQPLSNSCHLLSGTAIFIHGLCFGAVVSVVAIRSDGLGSKPVGTLSSVLLIIVCLQRMNVVTSYKRSVDSNKDRILIFEHLLLV